MEITRPSLPPENEVVCYFDKDSTRGFQYCYFYCRISQDSCNSPKGKF